MPLSLSHAFDYSTNEQKKNKWFIITKVCASIYTYTMLGEFVRFFGRDLLIWHYNTKKDERKQQQQRRINNEKPGCVATVHNDIATVKIIELNTRYIYAADFGRLFLAVLHELLLLLSMREKKASRIHEKVFNFRIFWVLFVWSKLKEPQTTQQQKPPNAQLHDFSIQIWSICIVFIWSFECSRAHFMPFDFFFISSDGNVCACAI